jgi:hypothetical protein
MDSSSHKGPRRDCDDQGYGILDLIKSCKQGEPKVESNGENRISFMPEILGQSQTIVLEPDQMSSYRYTSPL